MSFCGMRGTVPCSVAAGRGGSCPGSYCGPCTDHLAPWCALPTLCKESQPGPPRRKPDMRPMCAVAAAFVLTLFHEARDRVANSRGPRNVNSVFGLGSYKATCRFPGSRDESRVTRETIRDQCLAASLQVSSSQSRFSLVSDCPFKRAPPRRVQVGLGSRIECHDVLSRVKSCKVSTM